jgi:putative transposase
MSIVDAGTEGFIMDFDRIPEDWRISNDLWDGIALFLPKHKNPHPFGGGRPRTPDRVCMEAILFVLRTGCQWKALDATRFCPGSTAHDRFQEWVAAGVFEEMWESGLLAWDEFKGIDWSWLSMDGCMTKAPLGGEKTGKNPTDRAKRGVKRSLLVEGHGLPIGVAVEGANRTDMKMVGATLESIPVERPAPTANAPQGMCMDKGYDYDEVRELVAEFGFTTHIRSRGEEAKELKRKARAKARRWLVERTHSWMNRFRGILIRWNKKAENYIALLHMSFAFIIYRQMGLIG